MERWELTVYIIWAMLFFGTIPAIAIDDYIKRRKERKNMNYIMINGEKIEFTEEQVKKIKESIFGHSLDEPSSGDTERKKLSDVDAEDTFNAGKFEFIKLEQTGDDVLCLLKDTYVDDVEFGKNNNFDGSNYDAICKKFEAELAEIIGADNIVEHTVDLTSDDGLKCYGTAKPHYNPTWVVCVSPHGHIDYVNYSSISGVRPFCILKSDIFVS